MKKYLIIVLSAILFATTALNGYAEPVDVDVLHAEILSKHSSEVESIKQTVADNLSQWSEFLGEDAEKVNFDIMFRVYYLESKDLVEAYSRAGNMGALISDSFCWLVPDIEAGGEVQIVQSENSESGWAIRQGGHFHKKMAERHNLENFDITDIYENVLDKYPEANIESFRAAYEESRGVLLFYFLNGNEEYVATYFHKEGVNWITNGAIYRASDYISFFGDSGAEDSTMASISDKKGSYGIFNAYIILGSVAVICVGLIAVVRISKKKNK